MVLSTTSLHWLWPDTLDRVYQDLARLLRPGGLFLNGDHLSYGPESATLARLSQRVLDEQWSDAAFSERDIETAEQWWDEFGSEPVLAPLLAERARLFAPKQRQQTSPGFGVHVAALHKAGFAEVGTIWQVLSNRASGRTMTNL